MGRPRQIQDEAILETARACFIEQGAAASMEAIAARLGVSAPALLKRFGSKRELLKAAFTLTSEPGWIRMLEMGPDERELRTQLGELAQAIDGFFRQMVPAFAVLREAGIGAEEWSAGHELPPPVRGHRAMLGWLGRAQAQGRLREVDPEVLASVFMAGVQHRHFMAHLIGPSLLPREPENWLEQVLDVLWQGMAPGPGSPKKPTRAPSQGGLKRRKSHA